MPADRLTPCDIDNWADLVSRAANPNAYLAPQFMLPAMRHLDAGQSPAIHLVEQRDDAGLWRLQGLVALQSRTPDRHVPLGHAEGYLSRHSFLGGVLLDGAALAAAAAAMVDGWRRAGLPAVVLRLCAVDDASSRALVDAVQALGRRSGTLDSFDRATMAPPAQTHEAVCARLPSQTKRYLSATRKADPAQRVSLRVLRGVEIDADAIERHLALEHAGWKGEQGTSMRSHPEEEAFFRDLMSGSAAADRAVMVELLLGDRVIHSSSNLIDGRGGFAFKVGFDPGHAKLSPGILGEIGFLLAVREALPGIDVFDSGSTADSFITALWPDRRRVATLVLSVSRRGDLALLTQGCLRSAKHQLAQLRRKGIDGSA
ncbi:GNAT family N-acetyltransferase [Leptothrix sp. BB-4]